MIRCAFGSYFEFLINWYHSVVVILTLKLDFVNWFYLQETLSIQTMDHLILSFIILNMSLRNRSQRQNVQSRFRNTYKVFGLVYHDSTNWRFPKLKAFMDVQCRSLIVWSWDVLNIDIVGVDVNCLVRNDQLFEVLLSYMVNSSQYIDVDVSNLKFMLPVC